MPTPMEPGSNRYLGSVYIIDPETGMPVAPGVTIQQVEGGFDPTGLSTESKQDQILTALQDLTQSIDSEGVQEVVLTDEQLPPVSGQATATKQDQILSSLSSLASLLGAPLTVTPSGTLSISASSLPLPSGAATDAKQDAIISALGSVLTSLQAPLDVTGSVEVSASQALPVSGSVSLTNPSISVTPSGSFPVTIEGGATSAKQDSILTALGTLLTALQSPLSVTDNNGSITVDGSVGISGTPTVSVSNSSLPVTQSGTWNVTSWPGASATSTGLNAYRNPALTSTKVQLKSGATRLHIYSVFNTGTVMSFIQFYDALAANVTVGTTVPTITIGIPAGAMWDGQWAVSPKFDNGLTIAATLNPDGSGGSPATALGVGILGYV